MSVGERISTLRRDRNISQYQLSKLLGVSRQAVSKWENGQSSPDTVNLIQLADVLDVDVEYLATGKKPVPPSPSVVTAPKVVERIVEVEKVVEKPIPIVKRVERVIEKPVIRKVYRTKYLRNWVEYLVIGAVAFILGLVIGLLL